MTPAVTASADRLAAFLGVTRRQVWTRVRADLRIASVHGEAVQLAVEAWLVSAISESEAEQRAHREYSQYIQGLLDALCDDDPVAPLGVPPSDVGPSTETAS